MRCRRLTCVDSPAGRTEHALKEKMQFGSSEDGGKGLSESCRVTAYICSGVETSEQDASLHTQQLCDKISPKLPVCVSFKTVNLSSAQVNGNVCNVCFHLLIHPVIKQMFIFRWSTLNTSCSSCSHGTVKRWFAHIST